MPKMELCWPTSAWCGRLKPAQKGRAADQFGGHPNTSLRRSGMVSLPHPPATSMPWRAYCLRCWAERSCLVNQPMGSNQTPQQAVEPERKAAGRAAPRTETGIGKSLECGSWKRYASIEEFLQDLNGLKMLPQKNQRKQTPTPIWAWDWSG